MTLDQALYEMELVGHDFYLFIDSETEQPSVVYRRHGYDYGVIHLKADPLAVEDAPAGAGGALRRLNSGVSGGAPGRVKRARGACVRRVRRC